MDDILGYHCKKRQFIFLLLRGKSKISDVLYSFPGF